MKEIIEKCFQKFKDSSEGKLMHACNKNDDEVLRKMFNKMLLPFIELTLQESEKQTSESIDELERFFIEDWGAPDWGKKFPKFFTVHFDICRNKMGIKPKYHPKIVKDIEKACKVFEKAEEH